MSLFDDGIKVLRLAAEQGNRPAQAVLDELAFRETRITALHEINSDLNTALHDLRQAIAERGELRVPEYRGALSNAPAGWSDLFNGDFTPGVTRVTPMREGAV